MARVEEVSAAEDWVSLGEAARSLGINAGTLRRWADRGQIASYTTPGGHRRFPRSAIAALLPPERRPQLSVLGASGERMAAAYRDALAHPAGAAPHWLEAIGEDDRRLFRERGHRIAGCLLDHLDADAPEPAMRSLHEAARHATAYGRDCARLGAPLPDAVAAFVRFRAPFVAELAATAAARGLDARAATALMVDAGTAIDTLLVAFVEGWEPA